MMSSTLFWVVVVFAACALVAWYLSYTAARLDRLHVRVEGAHSALDAQLVRRAEATLELANTGLLDPASALLLAGASSESLESTDAALLGREVVESGLSEALHLALTPEVVAGLRADDAVGALALKRLVTAGQRVQLARRFLNDAVIDVRRVRRKLVVRWVRLAGHTPLPQTFEIDDDLPAALREA
jgi:hypothetical protein